jgi:hypothetical protein
MFLPLGDWISSVDIPVNLLFCFAVVLHGDERMPRENVFVNAFSEGKLGLPQGENRRCVPIASPA